MAPATHKLLEDAASALAESDPLRAVKVLAHAVRRQSRGAKVSLVRVLVEALAKHEPDFEGAALIEVTRLAAKS